MTLIHYPAASRGITQLDWLDSKHSFSFANYYDPERSGFHALRVLNDDIVAPKKGFGSHPHRDAEIFTYIVAGELEHRDSLGSGAIIRSGEIQYMSAGRGVLHSEINPSQDKSVHLLQIWLTPNQRSAVPRYEQRDFRNLSGINCVLSGSGRAEAISIRADADVFLARLNADQFLVHSLAPYQNAWIHMIAGRLSVEGELLDLGDDLAISNTQSVQLKALQDAEFFLFALL